jgi:hypothetical protein
VAYVPLAALRLEVFWGFGVLGELVVKDLFDYGCYFILMLF